MRNVPRYLPFVLVAFVLIGWPLAAAASDPPGLKRVPAKQVAGVDGKVLYETYCTACHGATGRGNGPAARFLTVPVPDLTTIAVRDGRFSVSHVRYHLLDSRAVDEAMPYWNAILRQNYNGDRLMPVLATSNLAKHIEKMQVTPASR